MSYTRGPEGELLSVAGGTEPASYTYDALYRVTSLADGDGHKTYYFYNTVGEMTQIAYPLSGSGGSPLPAGTRDTLTATAFDKDGHVLTRVDGNGTTTTYTYDDPAAPGLLLSNVHYTLPSNPPAYIAPLADTSLSYDAFGRVSTVTDASGTQTYAYDDADDPLSVTTTYTGLPAKTLSYAYNPDDSRASLSVGGVFTYAYDAAGRMTGLTNPYSENSAWTYLGNGWLATQSLSDGVRTTYARNPRGFLTDLTNAATLGPWAGTVLSAFGGSGASAMTYDGAGDRTAMPTDFPNAPAYDGVLSFGYDGKGELTGEASTRPDYAYDWSMAFDGAENRVGVNADNQWTGLTFDHDGNPETDDYHGAATAYDPEGRLSLLTGYQTYGYRADGLRAWKGNSSGGGKTYFYYDGAFPVLETDASGNVTAVTTQGANGVLSRHSSTGSVFYAFDPQGSAAQRLDCAGNILTYALFTAHGGRFGVNGSFQSDEPDSYSAPDPFSGFGGQWGYYDDNGNGAELLGHRYYEVGIGLFLTRDPLGYAGGVNLYNYVQNNPATETDPSGFCDPATDLGVDGDLSMRSLHPGMERGTYQNGLALGMQQRLKETLVNAALAPLGEFDILAEEGIAGEAAEQEAAASLSGPCFPAGTMVQAPHGPRPVQKVRRGDLVWSRDPVTGKTEARRVVRLLRHTAHALITVRLATKAGKVVQTLTATPGHRFFVVGRGAVPLGKLGVGTQIVTRAGPPLVIASLVKRLYPRGVRVYNFEVAGDHTYFVGNAQGGVWVHNDCTDIALDELMDQGEGAIIRVDPTSGPLLDEGGWAYHDVFLNTDGTVYDPMRLHANGLPFDDWVNTWQYADDYVFRYLSPEDIASTRTDLRGIIQGMFGP